MFVNNKTFFKSRLETDEAADILKDFQKAVLKMIVCLQRKS